MKSRNPRPSRKSSGQTSKTGRGGDSGTSPSIGSASTEEKGSLERATIMKTFHGVAVSPGLVIGPPLVVDPRGQWLPRRSLLSGSITDEQERLLRGLEAAKREVEAAQAEAKEKLGPQYADILAAHAQMISDPTLKRDASRRIEQESISAEHAVSEVLDAHVHRLESLTDSHLAARAGDVRDIQNRIICQLSGQRRLTPLDELAHPTVILAHDLSPSETAGLDPRHVLGFATEAGGRASHTAIVAEALEIPAVVGVGRFLEQARSAQMVIIDGDEGLVVLDPDSETLERYKRDAVKRAARFEELAGLATLPAETLDGARVGLWGNIEFPGEVAACLERGAMGVGLYRTEFLYLNNPRLPSEQEQFESYAEVVRSLQGRPVTIRTLDLGADKFVGYPSVDTNPALGLRSLRLSLREPKPFRTQLRAILRASALGDVRVMFPLLSTLNELRQARAILNDVAAELTSEGIAHRVGLPVGVMIEVPAAAVMADELAKEVDFFSIGTNDLVQYTLAVDRTNESVADLYSAADPAVLRLIGMVVAAARKQGIEVSICGTMGGEPLYSMLLLGLGVHQLSMPPHQLPEIKRIIRGVSMAQARSVAAEALKLDTSQAVVALLENALTQAFLADAATLIPPDRAG